MFYYVLLNIFKIWESWYDQFYQIIWESKYIGQKPTFSNDRPFFTDQSKGPSTNFVANMKQIWAN